MIHTHNEVGWNECCLNKAPDAIGWHEWQALWGADHLVEQGVHEIQRARELASGEVAFPHLHGDALGGVPCVGAESLRSGKAFHPQTGLWQRLNGTRLSDERRVEWKGHVAWELEVQRIS